MGKITVLGAMRFAFWPYDNLRPDWGYTRRLFVQAMAAPLISAGLLPIDHPTTKAKFVSDDEGEKIGALALLVESLRACPGVWQLRTWRDVHQLVVWITVALGYASIWIPPLGWLLYAGVGTAHAEAISQAVATQIAGNDVAQQWLKAVFGVTVGTPDMAAVQSGLGAMLLAYNTAVGGVGIALIFYHAVVVVMDFGREGKVGGRHNMAWSAIRLVVATGFLAPIAGFNMGQLAVIWMASEGSKVATTVWTEFTSFVADGKGSIVTPPLTRDYEEVLGTALMTEVCFAAFNRSAAASGDEPYVKVTVNRQLQVPWSQTVTGIERSYDGTNFYPRGVCGTQTFLPPESRPDAGASLMVAAQRDAFMSVLPDIQALAGRIVQGTRPVPPTPMPSTQEFRVLADKYAVYLSNRVAGAVAAQNGQAQADIKTDTKRAGWVLAPSWMLTFARLNGSLIEEATKAPKITGPALDPSWSEWEVQLPLRTANLYWHNALSDMGRPAFKSTAMGVTQTPLDELLGKFGFAEVVQKFQLKSADPLGELTAFGHRIMNWALGIFAAAMAIAGAAGAASAVPGIGIIGKGAVAMANFASPFLTIVVTGLLGCGATLAILLPWLPAVRWVLAVTSWLVGLLEAMLGLPLMLLAMLRTEGAGLLGAGGRNGGFLLLSLFLRPITMVICLVGAYAIFMAAISLWNLLFVPMMTSLPGGSSQGLVIATAHVILYTGTAWAVANICFRSIDTIPSMIVRWAGGYTMADQDYGNDATAPVKKGAETAGSAGQQGLSGMKPTKGGGGGGRGDAEIPPAPEVQTQDLIAKAD